ncbi:MAG: hypothetical protein ACM31L_14320 [Actinomycetota bacterium]
MSRVLAAVVVAGLAVVACRPAAADYWRHGHHHWHGPGYYSYGPPAVIYAPPPVVVVPGGPPRMAYGYDPVPVSPAYTDAFGRYCREYQVTVMVGGMPRPGYGTACMQPDGSWQMVR